MIIMTKKKKKKSRLHKYVATCMYVADELICMCFRFSLAHSIRRFNYSVYK